MLASVEPRVSSPVLAGRSGQLSALEAALFPDEDYRFQIPFNRAPPGDFFHPTDEHERLVGERRHWLTAAPQTYSALLP